MTKFKSPNVVKSVLNAFRGLRLAFFSQRNFVIETLIAIIVVISSILLKFNATDICILIAMSALVLVCELLNSVFEFTLDAVYKNKYSRLVRMAKDISAGMVLLACTASFFVGAILFYSYLNVT